MKNGFWKHGLSFVLFLSILSFSHFASATEYFVIIDDDDKFKPANLEIQLGDTVTWIHKDYTFAPHASISDDGYWDSGDMEPDDKFSITPPFTGTFSYYDYWSAATGSITVVGGNNTPPSITITDPVDAANFTAPATFSIQADASDSDGNVTNVEFYVDTTSIGNDATSPYNATASNLFAGNYILSAVAMDNDGAMTTNFISITVTNPIISLSTPKIMNGEFQFTISGLVAGKTNLIQTSTNLVDWVSVRTNLATSGSSSFTNSQSIGSARKFFQVIQLP